MYPFNIKTSTYKIFQIVSYVQNNKSGTHPTPLLSIRGSFSVSTFFISSISLSIFQYFIEMLFKYFSIIWLNILIYLKETFTLTYTKKFNDNKQILDQNVFHYRAVFSFPLQPGTDYVFQVYGLFRVIFHSELSGTEHLSERHAFLLNQVMFYTGFDVRRPLFSTVCHVACLG
jgi:hypothetical protein